jgi:hypothetical protein
VIGIGEMGSVFARAFLRRGHPVYPVTRKTPMRKLARSLPDPAAVVIAVGENALQPLLTDLPKPWREHIVLLQNELLPADYAGLPDPTVISIWFEKKRGQDSRVIIPSPVSGPRGHLLQKALGTLDIPVRLVGHEREMLFELVLKNLYILTSNIAGLAVGGNVGELWRDHQELTRRIAADVIRLQEAMTGSRFNNEHLIDGMVAAFDGDPGHRCMGRSAPTRLARALSHAERHQVEVPTLRDIAAAQAAVPA